MENITDLIGKLSSDEDAVRKMAVFKLQTNIGDPSFAETFISHGGLGKLRNLALNASGNTLAYSLTSFSRLLELDKGWDYVTPDLISRIVELIVTHPLVNILRGAMSILVAIVSHPHANSTTRSSYIGPFGFHALKPAIDVQPQFLEMLVSRLASADHALCANSLQLINSLMRDAITNDADYEWPKFIQALQGLGVIKAIFGLMQSAILQDLAHPLLEFQGLTKLLLRRWKDVAVNMEVKEHRVALKALHLASLPQNRPDSKNNELFENKKTQDKWRRLGFRSENPAWEFGETGFLGMMDLTDFARKDEDGFRKIIVEQDAKTPNRRCPVAYASITITSILYDQFEVGLSDLDENKVYRVLESRLNYDKAFRPLLLQWSRLHTATLLAFIRLWRETQAETADFDKVRELVRVLIFYVVGQSSRLRVVQDIEEDISGMNIMRIRDLQMENLEQKCELAWGSACVQNELKVGALQFIKAQRVRCLLRGSWFPITAFLQGASLNDIAVSDKPALWRYVRLSHNRRYLHYREYDVKTSHDPKLEDLPEKFDLSSVSSVVSNIVPASISSASSSGTFTRSLGNSQLTTTKITIHGYATGEDNNPNTVKEMVLLTLHPQTQSVASEWLDGLLMTLGQQPITNETNKLVNLVTEYGSKIRLLNVRYTNDQLKFKLDLPCREGVNDEYYYSLLV